MELHKHIQKCKKTIFYETYVCDKNMENIYEESFIESTFLENYQNVPNSILYQKKLVNLYLLYL